MNPVNWAWRECFIGGLSLRHLTSKHKILLGVVASLVAIFVVTRCYKARSDEPLPLYDYESLLSTSSRDKLNVLFGKRGGVAHLPQFKHEVLEASLKENFIEMKPGLLKEMTAPIMKGVYRQGDALVPFIACRVRSAQKDLMLESILVMEQDPKNSLIWRQRRMGPQILWIMGDEAGVGQAISEEQVNALKNFIENGNGIFQGIPWELF